MLNLIFVLIISIPTLAYEKGLDPTRLMNSVPERVIRLERAEKKKGRFPASMEEKRKTKAELAKELEPRLKVGSYAIIRDSVDDWNDQVVKITARYDDGSRQVQLDNGSFARVKYENLLTLSPETDQCCRSNDLDFCKNEIGRAHV